MKKINLLFVAIVLSGITLTSCWEAREIGRLNSVSVRNVNDMLDYKLLQKGVTYGYSKKEMKQNWAQTIESAVDMTTKKVDGGEYLMNAKIMQIIYRSYGVYKVGYVVEGDVWGIAPKK